MHSIHCTSKKQLGICLQILNAAGASTVTVTTVVKGNHSEYTVRVKLKTQKFDEAFNYYKHAIT